MYDRIVYGIGETGTWQTGSPTPHVTLDGGVPSGVSIVKRFDEALSSGEVVTVTVRIDADNWSCYGYESGNTGTVGPEFTSGNPDILDFSAAHLLASKGTLSPGDPVEVWAELPEPDYAQGNLETHKGSGDHDGRYTMSAHSVGTLNGADGHVSAQNRVDWNTAYAWGDHALAGYIIAADHSYDTAQLLRDAGVPSNPTWTVVTIGAITRGDGGGGGWFWDANSSATDNLGTVLNPAGNAGNGRWLRDYSGAVNVIWFGAVGDGITDDTAAIQGAIDYAFSITERPEVELTGNNFAISDSLILYAYTSLIGCSYKRSAIVTLSNDKPVIKINTSWVSIEKLAIKASNDSFNSSLIEFTKDSSGTLLGILIRDVLMVGGSSAAVGSGLHFNMQDNGGGIAQGTFENINCERLEHGVLFDSAGSGFVDSCLFQNSRCAQCGNSITTNTPGFNRNQFVNFTGRWEAPFSNNHLNEFKGIANSFINSFMFDAGKDGTLDLSHQSANTIFDAGTITRARNLYDKGFRTVVPDFPRERGNSASRQGFAVRRDNFHGYILPGQWNATVSGSAVVSPAALTALPNLILDFQTGTVAGQLASVDYDGKGIFYPSSENSMTLCFRIWTSSVLSETDVILGMQSSGRMIALLAESGQTNFRFRIWDGTDDNLIDTGIPKDNSTFHKLQILWSGMTPSITLHLDTTTDIDGVTAGYQETVTTNIPIGQIMEPIMSLDTTNTNKQRMMVLDYEERVSLNLAV